MRQRFSDHHDRTGRRRSDRLRLLWRLETHDILACGRHTDRDCHILALGDNRMYTRALISIEDADKKCRSIYVHHDGYPSGAGRTLIDHYTTLESAEPLLALGSLSAIGEHIDSNPGEGHSPDSVCIAYHRDRGEAFRPATVWANAEEMRSKASDRFWAEYVYLFRDGKYR